MDATTIRHELGRRRRLVGVVVALSIAVGLLVTHSVSLFPPGLESRKYEVGIATARMLVDTPGSQVVEVSPKGLETLGVRASLLASLMVDGEIKSQIAKRAGLSTAQLRAFGESTSQGADAAPEGTVTADADRSKARHLLKTRVLINTDGAQLPIIEVEAQAPNADAASNLASAAVTGLADYLSVRATEEDVEKRERLRVIPVGAPEVQVATRGPSRTLALAAAIATLLAGCAAILFFSGGGRDRHRTGAEQDEYEASDVLFEEFMGEDWEAIPATNGNSDAFSAPRDPSRHP